MSNNTSNIGKVVATILKTILLFCFKVIGIIVAWILKMIGEIFLSLGQFLETAVVKK